GGESRNDARRGGYNLNIAPETQKPLRPLVQTLLERAPAIPGWNFFAYRQPENVEMTLETVRVRTGDDFPCVRAFAHVGGMHRIDVVYEAHEDWSPEDERLPAQAFAATEGLVGEETLDKWIGVIEVAPDVPAGRWIPLERLKGTVDALIGSLVEQLPDQPCLDRLENAEWSMFTARPRRG